MQPESESRTFVRRHLWRGYHVVVSAGELMVRSGPWQVHPGLVEWRDVSGVSWLDERALRLQTLLGEWVLHDRHPRLAALAAAVTEARGQWEETQPAHLGEQMALRLSALGRLHARVPKRRGRPPQPLSHIIFVAAATALYLAVYLIALATGLAERQYHVHALILVACSTIYLWDASLSRRTGMTVWLDCDELGLRLTRLVSVTALRWTEIGTSRLEAGDLVLSDGKRDRMRIPNVPALAVVVEAARGQARFAASNEPVPASAISLMGSVGEGAVPDAALSRLGPGGADSTCE